MDSTLPTIWENGASFYREICSWSKEVICGLHHWKVSKGPIFRLCCHVPLLPKTGNPWVPTASFEPQDVWCWPTSSFSFSLAIFPRFAYSPSWFKSPELTLPCRQVLALNSHKTPHTYSPRPQHTHIQMCTHMQLGDRLHSQIEAIPVFS